MLLKSVLIRSTNDVAGAAQGGMVGLNVYTSKESSAQISTK